MVKSAQGNYSFDDTSAEIPKCAWLGQMHSPFDIAAVGTTFNVFSHDTMSGRDSNLPPSQQLARATVAGLKKSN